MLTLENAFFSYSPNPERTGSWTLSGIDFRIKAGEFVGIAGPTGSGKSTLAQLLSGLIKPSKGSLAFEGGPLAWKRHEKNANAKVGMAFQYPERQLFSASVREDVAFGPKNLGASEEEARLRADEALRQVGLDPEEIGESNPFQLSGGQQRKVALAGVLAMKPQVLILDEPAAGLDPASHDDLIALVRTLNSRDGLAIVMVSHSMRDLALCCQRIVVLNEGRVFVQGSPAEVFSRTDEIESIGLALPQALEFAQKMKKAGMPLPSIDDPFDLDSLADAIANCLRK